MIPSLPLPVLYLSPAKAGFDYFPFVPSTEVLGYFQTSAADENFAKHA
jgi:hypothetical protein